MYSLLLEKEVNAHRMEPLVSFGLIADPQYCDDENGNVEGRCQRYREVPGKLAEAVKVFTTTPALRLVLVLGDFINGRESQEKTWEDLELLAGILDGLGDVPACHVVGNHDLSYVSRQEWLARLKAPSPGYHSQQLAPGWRLVVLDTTDMSLHTGPSADSTSIEEARAYFAAHPISDEEPHMSDWNGGIGSKQMSWLKAELAAAEAVGDKVVVASHHPIGENCARSTHMAWNWREIQGTLVASPAVVLAFSGHDHMGGYSRHGNVHFITGEAMLEAPPGSNAYAVVNIFKDHIDVNGSGSVTSRKLSLSS